MFNSILVCLSFFMASTSFSFAQSINGLEIAVANKIDGLLSDTVNEGEMNASVKRLNRNKPSMLCSVTPSKKDKQVDIVKCDVEFAVEVTATTPSLKCSTSCFLIYKMMDRNLKTLTAVGAAEDSCIENISTTDCQ